MFGFFTADLPNLRLLTTPDCWRTSLSLSLSLSPSLTFTCLSGESPVAVGGVVSDRKGKSGREQNIPLLCLKSRCQKPQNIVVVDDV